MPSRPNHRFARAAVLCTAALAVGTVMTGCEVDSYMDPSIVGRWERTPTKVPILDRITAIEGLEGEYVEITGVQPEDLVPEIAQYRIAPGDGLEVIAYDLIIVDRPETFFRIVDTQGFVELPQLGRVQVAGLTAVEAREAIAEAMRALVADPLVSVQIQNPREQTYSVLGGTVGGGQFLIPAADFRILEALTTAGGISEAFDTVYVIRQTPLDNIEPGAEAGNRPPQPGEQRSAEQLLELIDDLEPAPSPAAFTQPDVQEPLVDLPDSGTPSRPSADGIADSGWAHRDGRWVREPNADADNDARSDLVTQRVIEVPVGPLLAGDARYNLVVRPGDVIRIPNPFVGQVYIAGQIARPGAFGLAPGLTLTRLIDSAGGLSAIAIPERVDLTRIVGEDVQATIRLNLRAIAEGTEPDIYIKPNDRVNIGTNFWATPLAVIRSGFRASYGFGFLLDRNFGNDVFGAPPSNVGNN